MFKSIHIWSFGSVKYVVDWCFDGSGASVNVQENCFLHYDYLAPDCDVESNMTGHKSCVLIGNSMHFWCVIVNIVL